MLTAFFGCSDEPVKSGQEKSDEILKINISEKSEINSAKTTEFSKEENKKSNAFETMEANSEFKIIIPNEEKMNSKLDYSPIGTWEANIDGSILIWSCYKDGNEQYDWYTSNGIQKDFGKWTIKNDILYEQYSRGSTACNIKFVTSDYFVLTIINNGNPNDKGQKRHFYRKKNKSIQPSGGATPTTIPNKPEVCRICWGTKTEDCGRCVSGKVRQQVQRERYNPYTERNDIYYEDEYVNCWEYGCNNGQVKCSFCKGTGYRN